MKTAASRAVIKNRLLEQKKGKPYAKQSLALFAILFKSVFVGKEDDTASEMKKLNDLITDVVRDCKQARGKLRGLMKQPKFRDLVESTSPAKSDEIDLAIIQEAVKRKYSNCWSRGNDCLSAPAQCIMDFVKKLKDANGTKLVVIGTNTSLNVALKEFKVPYRLIYGNYIYGDPPVSAYKGREVWLMPYQW